VDAPGLATGDALQSLLQFRVPVHVAHEL
jgi:hypothetical protein